MTPTPDDTRFAGDPESQALYRELQEPLEDEASTSTKPEELLGHALEHSMFSPQTQRFVDRVLSYGENPSPELRQRLTRAAARGVEYQRKQRGPLPILLAARREALQIDASKLAVDLQIPEEDVHKLESGELSVRNVEPAFLVSWAQALQTPSGDVVPALRRALELTRQTAEPIAAGRRPSSKLSHDDEKLLSKVTSLLET